MRDMLLAQYGLELTQDDEGHTLDNKQLLYIALCNSRLTIKDGIPQCIPIPNIAEPFLYIGSLGSAYNLEALRTHDITHILCLSKAILLKYPSYFQYKRIPMEDKPDFDIVSHWNDCFEFIELARLSSGRVLVHCYQGVSRSATVIIAYIMKYYGVSSMVTALEMVRAVRPQVAPNPGFLLKLRALEHQLMPTSEGNT